MEKACPLGSGPVLHETQLWMAGVAPVPDVVGSASAVRVLPPNSPEITPVCVPWATAEPLAPADSEEPVSVWNCSGAVHDPGEPGVNTAFGAVPAFWMSATSTPDGTSPS